MISPCTFSADVRQHYCMGKTEFACNAPKWPDNSALGERSRLEPNSTQTDASRGSSTSSTFPQQCHVCNSQRNGELLVGCGLDPFHKSRLNCPLSPKLPANERRVRTTCTPFGSVSPGGTGHRGRRFETYNVLHIPSWMPLEPLVSRSARPVPAFLIGCCHQLLRISFSNFGRIF